MSTVIVFGYGEMATAALTALAAAGAHILALVLPSNRTGPDLEVARAAARAAGLPVHVQPSRARIAPFVGDLRALAPDAIAVCSYSMILPVDVIDVPPRGCVNVHGGLLPAYRGPHVMQWAIINGESETGVTLHYIDAGIDTGPVIAEERVPIEPEDDGLTVRVKLTAAGARLLQRWWPAIATGTAPRVPQDQSRARYYPLRRPEDGRIDWSAPAVSISNLVRALVAPWPGAFTDLEGKKLVVRRVAPAGAGSSSSPPGLVCQVDGRGARVGTGSGDLLIVRAEIDGQAAGPDDLARLGLTPGTRLGLR